MNRDQKENKYSSAVDIHRRWRKERQERNGEENIPYLWDCWLHSSPVWCCKAKHQSNSCTFMFLQNVWYINNSLNCTYLLHMLIQTLKLVVVIYLKGLWNLSTATQTNMTRFDATKQSFILPSGELQLCRLQLSFQPSWSYK